jgi:excisionase family DNA binding protein
MTVREVAEYLRVNHMTVRREITAGRLPATKVGRLYRINEEDVKSFARLDSAP